VLVAQEFLKSLDDPVGRVKEILTSELYGLGLGFIPTFHLRLERVTPEVFTRDLGEELPASGFVAVVVASDGGLGSSLEQYGQVEVLN